MTMISYAYIARTGARETIQGVIQAESPQQAVVQLTQNGCFPVSLKPSGLLTEDRSPFCQYKVTAREVALFTRQLAGLVGAGVVVLNGLNILMTQAQNKHLKTVLHDIMARVASGKTLSESFAAYPDLFPGLYIAMLNSGEQSGKLEETLRRLADFLEKDQEFRSSVRSALVYPVFVFSVGVITVMLLLTLVIPRLGTMFQDMGQVLPLPTRMLIAISDVCHHYWMALLLGGMALVFLFNHWRATVNGKVAWDRFILRVPAFGETVHKSQIARLMQTLSLLVSSGMEILRSMDVAASVVDNIILKNELLLFKDKIRTGASLSRCLAASAFFPGLVTSVVAVGEETGTLDNAFARIAEEYAKDVERSLKVFTQLLEPVIILVMGVIVGFIVLAMLLPVFQINMIMQ